MIIFEYTPPLILLITALAAAFLIGLFSAWRYLAHTWGHALLPLLYGITLLVLFWCLLFPGERDDRTQLIKPRFLVAMDTSQSMTIRPNEEVATRWDTAQEALSMSWVRTLSAEASIELHAFDRELYDRVPIGDAGSLVPEGTSTRVRDSLADLAGRYAGLNVAGILLLSDGIDTREAFNDWATDPYLYPIYAVSLEDESLWVEETNVRIDTVVTPRRVSRGWETEFKVVVSGQGTDGQPVAVQLFRDDQLILEQSTQIPATGGQREVPFTLQHDEVGIYTYRVYVPPLPGESQVEDNEYLVAIAVADPRNRLLYVEGLPRFEYRFLRRTLLANEQIASAIFYTGPDGAPRMGSSAGGATAEMTESDLLRFRIVILGNLDADELTEGRAALLVQYVESGGSLVLLGGSKGWGSKGFAATPLETVLPFRSPGGHALEGDEPFPVEVTAAALAHPAFAGDEGFWDIVPPVLSVFPDAEPRPAAEVLVNANTPRGTHPVVITMRYGQGRVAAILTDTLWRWQLDPDVAEQQPYARFWAQLLSSMLPDEDDERRRIDLFATEDQIHIGERLELSARFLEQELEDGPPLEARVTLPDGREVPYAMTPREIVTPTDRVHQGFHLEYEPAEPGHYVVVAAQGREPSAITSDAISFTVRAYSPETAPRPMRSDLLRILASSSGGQYFESLDALNQFLSTLSVPVIEEERAEYHTLWRNWFWVVALMLLLTCTWLYRKMKHMP